MKNNNGKELEARETYRFRHQIEFQSTSTSAAMFVKTKNTGSSASDNDDSDDDGNGNRSSRGANFSNFGGSGTVVRLHETNQGRPHGIEVIEDLQGKHNGESGDIIASVIDQDQTCSLDTTLKEIQSNGGRKTFLDGFVEDHVLSSLGLLIEGKFLSLIGIPAFNENGFPWCLRHPNIAPILWMLKTSDYINLVLPETPYTLENILHYNTNTFKSEWHIKFLIYQLLFALAHMHSLEVSYGNVCPSNVMLIGLCWSWLRIVDKPMLSSDSSKTSKECSLTLTLRIGCCIQVCPSEELYADLKISQSTNWHFAFNKLSKSKWRLVKGDEQLDFTYSTPEISRHVSDECLSELPMCSYKPRRLPLSVLLMSMNRMNILLLCKDFTNGPLMTASHNSTVIPQIFYFIHSGMTDLDVPSWVGTPEEFSKLHRDALERNKVSCQIHHWIDITFGYKMSDEAAVDAKNVMLPASEPRMPRLVGCR
ncbi:hypothetical protein HYC85_013144 [Camellia sinensis]|uniref:BEACH domain-containing protein n=1 Tax=Camellia sinensis TaxID=4442 RepID=A0A7J7H3T4_CAMSI|nr:hypothetical protein HYC85_013144 [Camellia sinensis]